VPAAAARSPLGEGRLVFLFDLLGGGRRGLPMAEGGLGPAPCRLGIAVFVREACEAYGSLRRMRASHGFFERLAGVFAPAQIDEALGQPQRGGGVGRIGLPEHAEHPRRFFGLAEMHRQIRQPAESHAIGRIDPGDLAPPLAGAGGVLFVVGQGGELLGGTQPEAAGLLEFGRVCCGSPNRA
jgi:hypothetical protein